MTVMFNVVADDIIEMICPDCDEIVETVGDGEELELEDVRCSCMD